MEKLQIDLTKHLDKVALINYKRDTTSENIKYKDLLKQILKVGLVLEDEELPNSESVAIGILSKKSPASISLALAILEAGFAFTFITHDDIPSHLNNLGIKFFFSDVLVPEGSFLKLRNSLDVFGKKIRLYKVTNNSKIRQFNDAGDPLNRICYTITTSGTTGQRKVVRVTFNCIIPNLVHLQKIFRLDSDVIYSSAPCTFGVFVLDLFLALKTGSALMIIDESLRYSDESLSFMFSSEATSVTFMQITPSLFQQFGVENIRKKILSRESSLK
jgi:acyl-CoA synthetase